MTPEEQLAKIDQLRRREEILDDLTTRQSDALEKIADICEDFWPPDPHDEDEFCYDCSPIRMIKKVIEELDGNK